MVYLVQSLFAYLSSHCEITGMQNDDEVSPSIILVDQALLVKLLIPLELHGTFGSDFVYLCFLIFSSH